MDELKKADVVLLNAGRASAIVNIGGKRSSLLSGSLKKD